MVSSVVKGPTLQNLLGNMNKTSLSMLLLLEPLSDSKEENYIQLGLSLFIP